MQTNAEAPERLSWTTRGCLFAGIFCVFGLFASGELNSVDEGFIYYTTESMALKNSWKIKELADRQVSRYSLAPSLWGVPFFVMSTMVVDEGPDQEKWWTYGTQLGSCVATALTAVVLAAWIASLGNGTTVAVACALLFSFGSLAFPYSSALFPQVLSTLALTWCCLTFVRNRPVGFAIAFALAIWCRSNWLLLWPGFAVLAWRGTGARRWPMIGSATLGGFVGFGIVALIHHWRGDPIIAGGYAGEQFTTPLWIGISGLLLSFGKGLVWYCPIAFVGLSGTLWYAARRPEPGRLVLWVVLVQMITVGKWWAWHGAWSWGPRLLLPILPLCMLPVAEWLQHWREHWITLRRLFVLAAAAAVAVNTWATTQPQISYIREVRLLSTSTSENFHIPQTGPFGVGSFPPDPWLWRAPASNMRIALSLALGAGAVLGCGVVLGPTWRWWIPRFGDVSVAGILLVISAAVCFPALLDAVEDLRRSGQQVVSQMGSGQYRHLVQNGDGTELTGKLVIPSRGNYTFYNDYSEPLVVHLSESDIFEKSPIIAPEQEFAAGEYPIRIKRMGGKFGVFRWTSSGGAYYKQPVPADYLLSPVPTRFQRFRLSWRHHAWLLWIPAAVLACAWLMKPEAATECGTLEPSLERRLDGPADLTQ